VAEEHGGVVALGHGGDRLVARLPGRRLGTASGSHLRSHDIHGFAAQSAAGGGGTLGNRGRALLEAVVDDDG
jgi:hypothetical protein